MNIAMEKTNNNQQSSIIDPTIIDPLGPEEKARVLKERARALAGETAGIEEDEE